MKKLIVFALMFIFIANVAISQTKEKFSSEVVVSKCKYPKDYKGPKEINYQIYSIAEIFGLDPTDALKYSKNLPKLPKGAEGWFAVPKVSAVVRVNFPDKNDQYCMALFLACGKLDNNLSFINYNEGEIISGEIHQYARTIHFLDSLESLQAGDILIIAAQFGMLHRGESARRSIETFANNEFGLGTFHVACMSLVNPEMFSKEGRLYPNCPGDYIDSYSDVIMIPSFYSDGKHMILDCYDNTSKESFYGSASAFLP